MKKLLPPILFMIFAVIMFAANVYFPATRVFHLPYSRVGWLIVLIGVSILLVARLQFRKAQTNIYTFDEPGKLQTTGIFSISRHPMYLGFSILLLGLTISQGSWLGLPLVAGFVIITDRWYIAFEERWLLSKFGSDYIAYANRTRRWF